MRPELQDLADRLAAQYVLGTMSARVRRGFERRLRVRPDLQTCVARWEAVLTPMAATLTGPAPDPRTWQAIERRLDAGRVRRDQAGRIPASSEIERSGWLARWFGWRSFAGMSAGIAVGVLATLLVLPVFEAQGPTRVAVPAGRVMPESYAGFLADASGRPGLLVSSLRHGKVMDLKFIRPLTVGADQTAVLWALRRDLPPLRLGTVPVQQKSQLVMSDTSEQLLASATELAVSLESLAGALPDTPTQPFALRGPCAKFW